MNKLNLGCGNNLYEGYVNVDKYGTPDLKFDLETFPWPWETSSIDEIKMNHVLEHLGQLTDVFINIIKELYRVSKPEAVWEIVVPHPKCDDYASDPTHVRPITPMVLSLFNKKLNREWVKEKFATSTLGLYHDVDIEVESYNYSLMEPWRTKIQNQKITDNEMNRAVASYFNTINEIQMKVRVHKEN